MILINSHLKKDQKQYDALKPKLREAIATGFDDLRKSISTSEQVKRTAELTAIAVGKFCLKVAGVVATLGGGIAYGVGFLATAGKLEYESKYNLGKHAMKFGEKAIDKSNTTWAESEQKKSAQKVRAGLYRQ
jgi:hypothetical protein